MHTEKTLGRPARPMRKQPGEKLRDALLALAGGLAKIERHTERNWASITFAGTRHSFTLEFAGTEAVEAGEDFIALLPEHEFAIHGQLVADAAIVKVDHHSNPPCLRVSCELLLLEES